MPYLIDSDDAIDHLNNDPRAIKLLNRLGPEGAFISILTYVEVFQGVVRGPNPSEAAEALRGFLVSAPVLNLSISTAERCARLRQHLLDRGQRPHEEASTCSSQQPPSSTT